MGPCLTPAVSPGRKAGCSCAPPLSFCSERSLMDSDLDLLVRLQQVDAEIERASEDLGRIPQEVRIAEEELASSRGEYEAVEHELEQLLQGQKDCERKKADSRALLADYRGKLLQIRNNTEYRAMLDQIGFVEQAMDETDSRILELMYSEDEARAKLETARMKYDRSVQRTERKKQLLQERASELKASLGKLEARRAELAPLVGVRLGRRYEQLRGAGRRMAVVSLQRGACGGCMTNVPPQNAVEIEQGATYNCPICGRFVVCSADLEKSIHGE